MRGKPGGASRSSAFTYIYLQARALHEPIPMRAWWVSFVVFLGCGGSADDGTGDTQDSQLLAGDKLTASAVASHLRDAGFPAHAVAPMVCAAKYESSFFTGAQHKNRNGSTDYGLLQINDRLWAKPCGVAIPELLEPVKNIRCAKMVYDSGGLHSWYGYLNHQHECDAFVVPAAP
jgi:hypothetical protein